MFKTVAVIMNVELNINAQRLVQRKIILQLPLKNNRKIVKVIYSLNINKSARFIALLK